MFHLQRLKQALYGLVTLWLIINLIFFPQSTTIQMINFGDVCTHNYLNLKLHPHFVKNFRFIHWYFKIPQVAIDQEDLSTWIMLRFSIQIMLLKTVMNMLLLKSWKLDVTNSYSQSNWYCNVLCYLNECHIFIIAIYKLFGLTEWPR